MKIIEVNSFGRGKEEKFINLPPLSKDQAKSIVIAINQQFPQDYPRVWKVVPDDYQLTAPEEEPMQTITSSAWKALEMLPETLEDIKLRLEVLETKKSGGPRLGY